MHYEFLIEDVSGKVMLEHLIPRIIPEGSTFRIHPYRGIGRIPGNLAGKVDPFKRALLNNLPKLFSGYGRAFSKYPESYKACVFLICDLDGRDAAVFGTELNSILNACDPKPSAAIHFAIEEGEAWLLGHKAAVFQAYPNAKSDIINSYQYDAICGTWERLADAVFPGGSTALREAGWQAVGFEKSKWADTIGDLVDVAQNQSPSFMQFVTSVRQKGAG